MFLSGHIMYGNLHTYNANCLDLLVHTSGIKDMAMVCVDTNSNLPPKSDVDNGSQLFDNRVSRDNVTMWSYNICNFVNNERHKL